MTFQTRERNQHKLRQREIAVVFKGPRARDMKPSKRDTREARGTFFPGNIGGEKIGEAEGT